MNKTVMKKLIGSIICIVIGIAFLVYQIINCGAMKEELNSYISGFSCGIIVVGLYTMFIVINAMKNPNKGKELENIIKDERLIGINNAAIAITFRVCIFIEAIISIVCAFLNKMEISKYLGFAILFEVILYLITYMIIKRKKLVKKIIVSSNLMVTRLFYFNMV